MSSVIKAQPGRIKEYPLLNSINEINKDSPDTCLLMAFVNSLYNCPPCPRGAMCKPCIGDHIMIGDSISTKKLFRVFVNQPGKFSTGERYWLLIHLYKYNSEQEVYEGKLIEE